MNVNIVLKMEKTISLSAWSGFARFLLRVKKQLLAEVDPLESTGPKLLHERALLRT